MKKLACKILVLISLLNIITLPAYAGERLPAGTVLSEESYVFSIEEANKMKILIESLEKELDKKNKVIEQYKELDAVQQEQFELQNNTIFLLEERITKHKAWHEVDAKRIKSLEKRDKFSQVEKWGLFTGGVAITVAAILVADKIDDHLENN